MEKMTSLQPRRCKINRHYVLFIAILMAFLIIPNASAFGETKNFVPDGKYGTIEIYDWFNLPLISSKIAEYTLTSNTDRCMEDCYASGTASLYSEGTLFDGYDVKDLKGRLVTLKDFKIYLEEIYSIDVPDTYKEICENNKDMKNLTKSCHMEIDTYKKEQRARMTEYNGEILKPGNYNWNIHGEKDERQSVDWAVSIRGISTDNIRQNWQGWTATDCAGKGGIVAIDGDYCVHTFNSSSQLNVSKNINATILIVSGGGGGGGNQAGGGGGGGLNYTNVSLTAQNYTVIVGLGGTGGTDAVNNGWSGGNSSFGATINTTGGGGGGSYNGGSKNGANGDSGGGGNGADTATTGGIGKAGQGYNGGNSTGNGGGGGGGAGETGGNGNAGTAGNGGTGFITSINGSSICYAGGGGGGVQSSGISAGSATCGGGNGAKGNTIAGASGINGTGGGGGGGSNTVYDKGYSGGSGIVIVRYLAGTHEIAIINSIPLNNTNVSASSVTFGCNASGTTGANITSIILNVTGASAWTQTIDGLNTQYYNATFINSTLADGVYDWNCLAYGDTANGTSIVWTFTKDTISPSISIIYPAAINYSSNVSDLNFTASDTHAGLCNMSASAGTANSSIITYGKNFTGIVSAEGSNTWYLSCNDSFGNTAADSMTFWKDTVYPLIDYGDGTAADNATLSQNFIYINTTWTESNFKNITFMYSSATGGLGYITYLIPVYVYNFTSLPDETYHYNVTLCDTSDNCNATATRNITLDTIIPSVNITYPLNQIYRNINVSSLNYTFSDINLQACWYSVNLGATNTSISCGTNLTGLYPVQGSNTWIVWTNDSAGNTNSSSVTFSLVTSPAPAILNPSSGQNIIMSPANFTLNYSTGSDPYLQACWYSYNGGANTILANCDNATINFNNLSSNSIILYANDSFGIVNSTSVSFNALPTFALCNSTIPQIFLNMTFYDEIIGDKINATIDSSTWSYYDFYGNPASAQAYSFFNNTANSEYDYCLYPAWGKIYINATIKYGNGATIYPQRQYLFNSALTNATYGLNLSLLPVGSGQTVSILIVNPQLQAINGATILIQKGALTIASAITDASGTLAFFLSPVTTYTFTFSAPGYAPSIQTITPSQTQYTIQLGTIGSNLTSYTDGVSYFVLPISNIILPNTTTLFSFNISSSIYPISSFWMNLSDGNGNYFASSNAATNGGLISNSLNPYNNQTIRLDARWVISGNNFTTFKIYTVTNSSDYGYSIATLFIDLGAYSSSGMFGLNAFSLNLIIFIIIFFAAGIMSYSFGLHSPAAISGIVFALTGLFDFGTGLIATPITAIPHFAIIFMALVFFALVIKEETSF